MRILHLSDFHLEQSTIYRSQTIVRQIIETLQPFQEEIPIDLIICTGDLIHKGGLNSLNGLANMLEIFDIHIITPLLKSFNLPRERFLFCPGNHDMDKNLDNEYTENGLASNLITEEEITKLIQTWTQTGSAVFQRSQTFKNFEKKYYQSIDSIKYHYGDFQSSIVMPIDGLEVGVALLNSAWRCWNSKADKGNILIGASQLIDSYCDIKDCQVKIAIAHHDTSWLRDFDAVEVQRNLYQGFDMFFTGHTHSEKLYYQIQPDGSTFNIVSPGILASNIGVSNVKFQNGFSLIDYDLANACYESRIFKQEGILNFKQDLQHGQNGVWTVPIPTGASASNCRKAMAIKLCIQDKAQMFNEHLLSYKTHSCAPQSISEIFVSPHLTIHSIDQDKDNQDDTTKPITIDEIVTSSSNYVLFGIKESGKTILLDKILLDILNRAHGERSIPVWLNFAEITKDMELLISSYWQQRKQSTREIIDLDNVILLIDNIDFTDTNKLRILNDFLSTHPKIRYVGTSLVSRSNDINIDVYNQPLLNFVRVNIEAFSTHQIRELVKKWISGQGSKDDVQKRVNIIVDAFTHLNIPRTPFAISMFLWIIERQESYKPQNNALMIQSYIRALLSDGDNTAIREEFDSGNKCTVLAEIAYNMLKSEEPNYAIRQSEMQKIIEDKLLEFHFTKVYKAHKIYADFVRIGLFVEEPCDMIRFRFTCFFEYFLYEKMKHSEKFFCEVLNDQNYMQFYNELVFYTGINRNDDRIIKRVMSDLEFDYIDINEMIFQKNKAVDEYFNIGTSLLAVLTANDLMKVLPDKETEASNDANNDAKLQCVDEQCQNQVIKKKDTNKFIYYGKILTLAMDILKNCEELPEAEKKEEEKKPYYYRLVLKNSISYAILFCLIAKEMLNHSESFPEERIDDMRFMLRFLPVLHEELIKEHLGTYKLSEIIRDKAEEDSQNKEKLSEFERFLSVFLLADLKGPEYEKFMSQFLSSFQRAYIADASYLKLLEYYYSSKDKQWDQKLLSFIGDLYVKTRGSEHNAKKYNKGNIIASFQQEKKRKNNMKQ